MFEMKTFLIIPGAWHGAGHWSEVVERLVAAGHRAVAVDLPGTGRSARFPRAVRDRDLARIADEPSAAAGIGLAEYEASLLPLLVGMATERPVMVVGHSFGGVSASLLAERRPELVAELIYVTAHVPVTPSANSCKALDAYPENATSLTPSTIVGDPARLGAFRIDTRSTDPAYREAVRAAFCADADPAALDAWTAALAPDMPVKAAIDTLDVSPGRWGTVPRRYIRCIEDRALPIALQDRMIREADELTPENRFRITTFDSSHSPFLSVPGQLVSALLEGV